MGFLRGLISFLMGEGVSVNVNRRNRKYSTDDRLNNRKRYADVQNKSPEHESRTTIEEVVASVCEQRQYTFITNVDVNIFGDEYSSKYKFSYLIVDQEENIKAAVLIVPHNGERNRHFYQMKDACAKRGLPFVYFYEQMSNERSYVESKIVNVL